MLFAIVVLHLVVHDCDTGALLYEAIRAMPSYANSIEDCRKNSIENAQRFAFEYRKSYPKASVNIDCEWRRGPAPSDPA
jgi:hypothetical protein